jgi:hypothetical protein
MFSPSGLRLSSLSRLQQHFLIPYTQQKAVEFSRQQWSPSLPDSVVKFSVKSAVDGRASIVVPASWEYLNPEEDVYGNSFFV